MTLFLQRWDGAGPKEVDQCMVLHHEHYTKSTPIPKKSQPRSEAVDSGVHR